MTDGPKSSRWRLSSVSPVDAHRVAHAALEVVLAPQLDPPDRPLEDQRGAVGVDGRLRGLDGVDQRPNQLGRRQQHAPPRVMQFRRVSVSGSLSTAESSSDAKAQSLELLRISGEPGRNRTYNSQIRRTTGGRPPNVAEHLSFDNSEICLPRPLRDALAALDDEIRKLHEEAALAA